MHSLLRTDRFRTLWAKACGVGLVALLAGFGCATTRQTDTSRTGVEQLLISNAVDQSLDKVDFSPLRGRNVLIQEKYLDGVDKNYVVGSLRHRVLATGARLVDKEEDSEVVLEVRSGGIGTDRSDSFVGSPQIAIPFPLPLQLPEVRLIDTRTQLATAKIAIVAYHTETRQAIGTGGTSLARSTDINRSFLGIGPFNSGNVRQEVQVATGTEGLAFDLGEHIPWSDPRTASTQGAPVLFQAPAQSGPSQEKASSAGELPGLDDSTPYSDPMDDSGSNFFPPQ
jgi:hypothetical protein